MIVHKAVFVKSASKFSECPEPLFPEFAFIGRSNVGKSSLINMLTQHGSLSKVSVKPGKTQLMNFFLINDKWYFVDLPGYGYASSSFKNRSSRIDTVQEYFMKRDVLKRIFVLVDGSLPPQKIDIAFMNALVEEGFFFDIVMTKIDKVTQKVCAMNFRLLKDKLEELVEVMPKIFLVSNVSKKGRVELLNYIQDLMG